MNANTPDSETALDEFSPLKLPADRHHPYIVELIAEEAGVSSSDVLDFEMILYDTQHSLVGGLNNEYVDILMINFPLIDFSTNLLTKYLSDSFSLLVSTISR